MVKTAIIGVTGYGRVQLRECLKQVSLGEMELVAAVVVNPEQAGEQLESLREVGCRVFADADAMWAEFANQIDLCVLPVPIHLHARLTIQALQAGANVLVEKPFCGSPAEAMAMREVEQATGKFIAVGFQDVYDPHTRKAKQDLLNGRIGKVKSIRGFGLWPRGFEYYNRNNWAGKLFTGDHAVMDSPFNNAMAHFLNMELFLGGTEINAMAEIRDLHAELYRANNIQSFDTGTLHMVSKNDVEIFYAGTHACSTTVNPVLQIAGTEGTLDWVAFKHMVWTDSDGKTEQVALVAHDKLTELVVRQCLERVKDPTAFICTSAMAMTHVEVIARMHHDTEILSIDAAQRYQEGDAVKGRLCIRDIETAIPEAVANLRHLSQFLPVAAV